MGKYQVPENPGQSSAPCTKLIITLDATGVKLKASYGYHEDITGEQKRKTEREREDKTQR